MPTRNILSHSNRKVLVIEPSSLYREIYQQAGLRSLSPEVVTLRKGEFFNFSTVVFSNLPDYAEFLPCFNALCRKIVVSERNSYEVYKALISGIDELYFFDKLNLQALKERAFSSRKSSKSLQLLTEKEICNILRKRRVKGMLFYHGRITFPQYKWIKLTLAGESKELVEKKLGYSTKSIYRHILEPLCYVFDVPNEVELIRKVRLLGVG